MRNYKLFIEALKPSQFKRYVQEFNKERYEELFQKMKQKYDGDRNAYRIYMPLIENKKKGKIEKKIKEFLEENNYIIIDYIDGKCKHKNAKNPSRLGQALKRLGREDLLNQFNEDPDRKHGEELIVCISRHPYDIAGADTDRRWTNCMTLGTTISSRMRNDIKELRIHDIKYKELDIKRTKLTNEQEDLEFDNKDTEEVTKKIMLVNDEMKKLQKKLKDVNERISDRKTDGCNSGYLLYDVREGSLISFLIKKSDRDIKDPIADLNIKPYISTENNNDFILECDKNWYGEGTKRFKTTVENWLAEINEGKSGIFTLKPRLYDDSEYGYIFKLIDKSADRLTRFIRNTNSNRGTFVRIIMSDDTVDKDVKQQFLKYCYTEGYLNYSETYSYAVNNDLKILDVYKEEYLNALIDNRIRAEHGDTMRILTELHSNLIIESRDREFIIYYGDYALRSTNDLSWFIYNCYKKGFIKPNNEMTRLNVLLNFRKFSMPLTEEEQEFVETNESFRLKEQFRPVNMKRPRLFSSFEQCFRITENGYLTQRDMNGMKIDNYLSRIIINDRVPDDEKRWLEETKNILKEKYK